MILLLQLSPCLLLIIALEIPSGHKRLIEVTQVKWNIPAFSHAVETPDITRLNIDYYVSPQLEK